MARGLRLAALLLRESGRLRLVPGVLVAYLACRGDRVSREALAGRFWPERAGKVVGNVTSRRPQAGPIQCGAPSRFSWPSWVGMQRCSSLYFSSGRGVGPVYGPECAGQTDNARLSAAGVHTGEAAPRRPPAWTAVQA